MASTRGKGLTSLYADLLEPKPTNESQSSTISKPPVVFTAGQVQTSGSDAIRDNDTPASAKKQVSSAAAALRFQPIPRRPQPSGQKNVKKTGVATFAKPAKSEPTAEQQENTSTLTTRAPIIKSSLEDWATNDDDDDVNGFYSGNSRQRGGRKRRKKNKEKEFERSSHSWDDIYDPSRPNLYEEYKDSEEKDQEIRDWRDRLYGRRRAFSSDESEDERPRISGGAGFAPPPNLNFAPPPSLEQQNKPEAHPEPAQMLDAPTGEEIWMMRARMTQQATVPTGFAPSTRQELSSSSFVDVSTSNALEGAGSVDPGPPNAPRVGTTPNNTAQQDTTISRAPVLYKLPHAPPEFPSDEQLAEAEEQEDLEIEGAEGDAQGSETRSSRPGQKGFAERLMSKYGWTKGSGLGANSSGMVHALQVKAAKGKDSKGVGKILDKNTKRSGEDNGKFGKMSEVIVLHNMVDGLEGEDPGVLMQEIGDECSEKYGRIERVHIVHKAAQEENSKVFVQFTSQLSALRAVNALEGRMFNGNTITARFFDAEDFVSQRLG